MVNRIYFLAAFMLFLSTSFVYGETQQCLNLNNRVSVLTGNIDIGGVVIPADLIKNDRVSHVLVNTSIQISDKKSYHCALPDFDFGDCIEPGTGRYSFWHSKNVWDVPVLLSNFNKNRDYHYTPTTTGVNYVTSVATDSKALVTLTQTPTVNLNSTIDANLGIDVVKDRYQRFAKDFEQYFGMTLKIPFCDTVTVYAQNLPSVQNITIKGGQEITVSSEVKIDSFSKFALTGKAPKIVFHIRNDISGQTTRHETSSGHIVFSPMYNGPHLISIEVFDGTFTSTQDLGSVFYRGGQPCCGGDIPL